MADVDDTRAALGEMEFKGGFWKAASDCIKRVKVLLNKGHDPSAKKSESWSPLHYAIKNHHTSMCEILLERGVDIKRCTFGETRPLYDAVTPSYAETVGMLRRGANANLKDADGKTALHHAVSSHASSRETLQDSSSSSTCTLLLQHSGQTTKELASQKYKEAISNFGLEIEDPFLEKWLGKNIDLGEASEDKKSLQNKQTLGEELKAMELGKELEMRDKKLKNIKIKRLAREYQPKNSAFEEYQKHVNALK